MTDVHPTAAALDDDGSVLDTLTLTVDTPPGGDGGSSGVGTDQDPGGDGGNQGGGTHVLITRPGSIHSLSRAGGDGASQGVGTDQDPGGDGGTSGVGTDQDPTNVLHVAASGDGGNQGVGTDQDPGGNDPLRTPPSSIHDITMG